MRLVAASDAIANRVTLRCKEGFSLAHSGVSPSRVTAPEATEGAVVKQGRMRAPRVTVLMPVYNAAPYLLEAVDSILKGTFADLELLAINDGSTDESEAILRAIPDPRLTVVSNPGNQGVIATLNRGLDLARGEFVARMDADDVSTQDRLANQVAFMEANPEIGLSGTWVRTFGAEERVMDPPLSPVEIHMQLFAFNAICHPAVIFRRGLFAKHGLRYAAEARHAEDLDLWMRAANHFRLANIPTIGLLYRMHANQVTKRFDGAQLETLERLQRRQLLALVPDATESEIKLHLKAVGLREQIDLSELKAIGEWLEILEGCNKRAKRYETAAFKTFVRQRWLNSSHRCGPRGIEVWRTWRQSPLSVGTLSSLRLLGKMCLHR